MLSSLNRNLFTTYLQLSWFLSHSYFVNQISQDYLLNLLSCIYRVTIPLYLSRNYPPTSPLCLVSSSINPALRTTPLLMYGAYWRRGSGINETTRPIV